ncbi:hypothetical protein EYB26_005070 [Talaromyces marneffei]|uniref:uncharacterized protein n=1 Tax=Talaromyces marneffei TaxID=37727 RepID=UPI0012AA50AB|nr:uncharacterized protein EYB26_005070 [Talaromyces marneffei]QGA17399.1 hypothetical protein EYB26_005070 [Talaromyces marneffei]
MATMTAENTKSSVESLEKSAKKQSKWSAEEDAVIIDSRGKRMQWHEISKLLPGRSATSCRLHYQNYLERPEWDEDKKIKLAQLYERFKADMWIIIAQKMELPWRAVESMHWKMGEQEMARRVGVIPVPRSEGPIKLRAKGDTRHKSKPRHHSPKIDHQIRLSPRPGTTILPPPMSSLQPPKPSLPPPTSSLQPQMFSLQPLKHPQGQLRLPSLERLIAGDPVYGTDRS